MRIQNYNKNGGDISATWSVLKKQIVEGINFSLSGMPYWSVDIGGFFVVGSAWQKRGCGCSNNPKPLWFWKGDYNDGVKDLAYRELYVRWLEYGTFLPMFRSHGTDTPREIWNFGKKGEKENATIVRSLLFDFLEDIEAGKIEDEFMFGNSILVCPITEPLYYDVGWFAVCTGKDK